MLHSNESRRAQPLLGTLVDIRVSGGSPASRDEAVSEAFSVVKRIHHLMSFHEAASDVSRLNREAAMRPVRVHRWTWEVLSQASEISDASDGVFDVTVAPYLVAHGFLPTIDAPRPNRAARWSDVELLDDSQVRFRRSLWLDLGGIAKGFAVDRAIETLASCGVARAVVNAGGDLRVFGPRAEPVHVRDPAQPGRMLLLAHLENEALATSAGYFACNSDATPYVLPRIRESYPGRESVSVQTARCAMADALTKVVLLAREAAQPVLQKFDAVAHIIDGDAMPRAA